MARARTAETSPSRELAVIPEQIRKCCGSCAGFVPFNGFPSWGDCLPSRAAAAAPRATQDMACCSSWSRSMGSPALWRDAAERAWSERVQRRKPI